MPGARQEAIHAMGFKIIFAAILLSRLFQTGKRISEQDKCIERKVFYSISLRNFPQRPLFLIHETKIPWKHVVQDHLSINHIFFAQKLFFDSWLRIHLSSNDPKRVEELI